MCYVPEGLWRVRWTVLLLVISGLSLVLQATVTAMRFKERSARGRKAVNELEVFILNRRAGVIDDKSFLEGVKKFLNDTSQEESP